MTEASYDRIASWYDNVVRTDNVVNELVTSPLLNLIGDVKGKHACDLACGQGRIARELTKRGAQVVGVDISADLIAIAQTQAFSDTIKYIVDDAQTLNSIEDECFDLVVCNLALMDIPDLNKTLESIYRILRAEGSFVFSITHPCFEAPHSQWITSADGKVSREILNYIKEGFWRSTYSEGVRGKVGAHHRMLSTYMNTLSQAGFNIVKTVEPVATNEATKQIPRFRNIPAFMIMRCLKAESY